MGERLVRGAAGEKRAEAFGGGVIDRRIVQHQRLRLDAERQRQQQPGLAARRLDPRRRQRALALGGQRGGDHGAAPSSAASFLA